MNARRLSERARAGTKADTLAVDPSALLEDVLGHLRELFNVRQGSVPIRPDYGMPDFNDVIHAFPAAAEILRAEIVRQIEKFEPRLDDFTVRYVPSPERPLSMIFRIAASLPLEGAGRISVETEVAGDGMVRVST